MNLKDTVTLIELAIAAGALWFTTVAITMFVVEMCGMPVISDEEWEVERTLREFKG